MDRKKQRVIATIEARMNSSRLPGKILMPLVGKPSLERLVERARKSKKVEEVIVATTVSASDDAVERWAKKAGVSIYRGSEEDVLLRVLEAAKAYRGDVIVELTGDCPLVEPAFIDELVAMYQNGDYDYVSNILERTYPRGWDTQVFSTALLERVHRTTNDPADRENVSLYIYEHPEQFKLGGIKAPKGLFAPHLRICVDTPEDFKLVEAVYNALYPANPNFTAYDVMEFLNKNPQIAALNKVVTQKKVRA